MELRAFWQKPERQVKKAIYPESKIIFSFLNIKTENLEKCYKILNFTFYLLGDTICILMENLNELIQKARKGDKDAFGQIYKIYYRKIYRYLRINLNSQEAAEDLAQETFLKAWRSISTFFAYSGGSLQAFLFRIARNLMIDLSREKKEFPLDTEIESKDDFEEGLDRKTNIETVQKALSKLEDEDKQLVILRFFEEMPHADIAQIIDSNEGAVRVKLHRILKKLKGIINE